MKNMWIVKDRLTGLKSPILQQYVSECIALAFNIAFERFRPFIRTFQDIINCEYVKTAELCGLEAANILRGIDQDVFNGVLMVVPFLADIAPFQ